MATLDPATGKALQSDYEQGFQTAESVAIAVTKIIAKLLERLLRQKAIEPKKSHKVEIKIDGKTVYKGQTGEKPEVNKLTPQDIKIFEGILGKQGVKDLQIAVDDQTVYQRANGVVQLDRIGDVEQSALSSQALPGKEKNATPNVQSSAKVNSARENKPTSEPIAVERLQEWREAAVALGDKSPGVIAAGGIKNHLREITRAIHTVKRGGTLSAQGVKAMNKDFRAYANQLQQSQRAIATKFSTQKTIQESVAAGQLDSDGDGIPDYKERKLGLNPHSIDSDRDGTKDLKELQSGGEPHLAFDGAHGENETEVLQQSQPWNESCTNWTALYNTDTWERQTNTSKRAVQFVPEKSSRSHPLEKKSPTLTQGRQSNDYQWISESDKYSLNLVRNTAAVIASRNVIKSLEVTGEKSFQLGIYRLEHQGNGISVTTTDGRGEIVREADGKITGNLEAKDVVALNLFDRVVSNRHRLGMDMEAAVTTRIMGMGSEVGLSQEEAREIGEQVVRLAQTASRDSNKLAFVREGNETVNSGTDNKQQRSISSQLQDKDVELEM